MPLCRLCRISIHAPTRGATTKVGYHSLMRNYFNPRSYKRSDGIYPGSNLLLAYFNPRSYKRSDENFVGGMAIFLISIHAPTRGATAYGSFGHVSDLNFNPRSYKRSDLKPVHFLPVLSDFNPRSYKRSDLFDLSNFFAV